MKLFRTPRSAAEDTERLDVLIVGAGPAGLGCAVALKACGVEKLRILERDRVGAAFERWPAQMRMITPSFHSNPFGQTDLNSITPQTSPADFLGREHPSGEDYARYLRAVAEYYELPVETGTEALSVESDGREFVVETDSGPRRARFVIWAAGEFFQPHHGGIVGAEHCLHNSEVADWSQLPGVEHAVVGGFESSIDAAVHLARAGKSVHVFSRGEPWHADHSDPSRALTPYTRDRLKAAFLEAPGSIRFYKNADIVEVRKLEDRYLLQVRDDEPFEISTPPILCTGFRGGLRGVEEHFRVDEGGAPGELALLLPVAADKTGFVVLTFADRLAPGADPETAAAELSGALGVPVFAVDARHLTAGSAAAIRAAAAPEAEAARFPETPPVSLPDVFAASEPRVGLFEKIASHPLAALALLFLPAALTVINANRFADWLYEPLSALLEPILGGIAGWPGLPAALFGGDYGLVAMFPFLVLYAAPTILVFSAMLAVYKSSGLIDRISVSLHPWLRPFGIGGRDLVRVVMGFGCNVPAVVASRACHSCSRGACISAISFGSACSYQLPATLAVFAAAGMAGMGLVYLAVLAATTLVYLRFTTPKPLRLAGNALLLPPTDPLHRPSWRGVWRETAGNLKQFVLMAFPVFVAICFAAAALAWIGVLDWLARALTPLMALFNLPGDAATAVVLGSIRKDGLAIGFLDLYGTAYRDRVVSWFEEALAGAG